MIPLKLHLKFLERQKNCFLLVARNSELSKRSQGLPNLLTRSFGPLFSLSNLLWLRSLLKNRKIKIIFCHYTRDLFWLRTALLFSPDIKLVVQKHIGPGPPKKDLYHRWVYQRVDRLLSVSSFIRQQCLAAYPIAPEKVVTFYTGIEPALFQRNEQLRWRIRSNLGISRNQILFGTTNRLTPGKGYNLLLPAIPEIIKLLPGARFLFLGRYDPAEKTYALNLQKLSRKLAIDHCLHWLGHKENVADYLSAIDIFLNLSENEAFGLVTLEAMAAGLAVIGFDRAGTKEIITHNHDGLLIPYYSRASLVPSPDLVREDTNPAQLTSELVKTIVDLAKDEKKRLELGKQALKTVQQKFDLECSLDRLQLLFAELISNT